MIFIDSREPGTSVTAAPASSAQETSSVNCSPSSAIRSCAARIVASGKPCGVCTARSVERSTISVCPTPSRRRIESATTTAGATAWAPSSTARMTSATTLAGTIGRTASWISTILAPASSGLSRTAFSPLCTEACLVSPPKVWTTGIGRAASVGPSFLATLALITTTAWVQPPAAIASTDIANSARPVTLRAALGVDPP